MNETLSACQAGCAAAGDYRLVQPQYDRHVLDKEQRSDSIRSQRVRLAEGQDLRNCTNRSTYLLQASADTIPFVLSPTSIAGRTLGATGSRFLKFGVYP